MRGCPVPVIPVDQQAKALLRSSGSVMSGVDRLIAQGGGIRPVSLRAWKAYSSVGCFSMSGFLQL